MDYAQSLTGFEPEIKKSYATRLHRWAIELFEAQQSVIRNINKSLIIDVTSGGFTVSTFDKLSLDDRTFHCLGKYVGNGVSHGYEVGREYKLFVVQQVAGGIGIECVEVKPRIGSGAALGFPCDYKSLRDFLNAWQIISVCEQ